MSRLRNSSRLHKGAIVGIESLLSRPTVIGFQYNPESMSRSLSPHTSGTEGSKSEVQRVDRPPTENIKLTAEFDATDGLEARDPVSVRMGVYPELSALETLLYPPRSKATDNGLLAALGIIEVVPPMAPLILFVWGPKRVLPVRIESLSIEESAYDERLNPIQAKADLDLRVLNYADFCGTDPGAFIFMAHHAAKEAMASIGSARSIVNFF